MFNYLLFVNSLVGQPMNRGASQCMKQSGRCVSSSSVVWSVS